MHVFGCRWGQTEQYLGKTIQDRRRKNNTETDVLQR